MGLLQKLGEGGKEAEGNDRSSTEHGQRQRDCDSDSDCPPTYRGDASTSGSSSAGLPLAVTTQLQIDAVGFDFNAAMSYYNHEQITVKNPQTEEPRYISLRPKKKSNSCALSRCDSTNRPITATVYRIGPGRHPRIKILDKSVDTTVEDAIESDNIACETIEVDNKSLFSRTQVLRTSFGTFQWRYGSREERKAAYNADSLLVMELVDSSKNATRVAQLMRNDELRTTGTKRFMGGNGGRLMMDLSRWQDSKLVVSANMEAFIVASCICMLKREADRFKNNAIAAVT